MVPQQAPPGAVTMLARFAPGALEGVDRGDLTVLPALSLAVGPTEEALRALAPEALEEVVPLLAVGPAARRLVTALDRAAWYLDLHRRRPVEPGAGLLVGRLPGEDGGYPALDPATGRLVADPARDHATEPAVLPVVSLSLGPDPGHPMDRGDPVQAATEALARRALVVMAVGNDGGVGATDTTSAWARAPWVLGVGSAEVDGAGRVDLAPSSSRGTAAQGGSGPFVVADGRSAVPPHPFGTSFAAPRVAGLAADICAAVLQLLRVARAVAGDPADLGVPLVAPLVVDTFSGGDWYPGPARAPLRALPLLGPTPAAQAVFARLATGPAGPLAPTAGAGVIAQVLAVSARPVPGREAHEVGHGYVDREGVVGAVTRITAAGWLTLLGAPARADELPPALAAAPLLDEAGVRDLFAVADAAMPVVMLDRTTYEMAARAEDPAGWIGARVRGPRDD